MGISLGDKEAKAQRGLVTLPRSHSLLESGKIKTQMTPYSKHVCQ